MALVVLKKLRMDLQININLLKQKDRKFFLMINRTKTGHFYLKYDKKIKKRTYISKNDKQTIRALAQDTYESKLLKCAQKELSEVECCIKKLENGHNVNNVFDSLANEIKAYVIPMALDDEYAKAWQEQRFRRYNIAPSETLKADRGEYVRSKTELYIANRLYALGIPYHYEKPLMIKKNNSYCHPDFTILNKRTREVFIWEHLGLMGDSKYRESNIEKIELYASEGYVIGKNLIITFESGERTLSTEFIDTLIKELFL